MPRPADVDARVIAALPPLDARARERAAAQDWELELLDPLDADERSLLIRLAHPDCDEAIEEGRDEIVVGGERINPRMHLIVHEVVATQIIDDDPPEAFTTVQRLIGLGRDPHEVLHMLGGAVTAQIWGSLREQRPHDQAEYLRALAALPGSWDRLAAGTPARPPRPHARRGRGGRRR